MTPQEKAEQILDKYYPVTGPFTETKQCALIAVDEVINEIVWHHDFNDKKRNYWQEVKTEIEKL